MNSITGCYPEFHMFPNLHIQMCLHLYVEAFRELFENMIDIQTQF